MSDHVIAVLLYCLAGLNILIALASVAAVGKPRAPTITPGWATYTVTAASLVCTLEVLAAGRLLHG